VIELGLGDQLMGTGMARGAHARGKRIAFGDGSKIIWDHHSEIIFRGNPNIAAPGSEDSPDLEWIAHYRGHRLYNRMVSDHWVFNYDFRPIPGEMFFSDDELAWAKSQKTGFIIVEPNLPEWKSVAPNKRWPADRYEKVARYLVKSGHDVRQFVYGSGHRIPYAKPIKTPTFRHALAVLARALLHIGAEGGLHHGAAAVGIPAVVLFGGFTPPEVTGYPTHTNLTGGAKACGSLHACPHCREAMEAISVDEVYEAARVHLAA
jgi:hypothetical protein